MRHREFPTCLHGQYCYGPPSLSFRVLMGPGVLEGV